MNTPKKPRVRKKRLDEFDSLASVDMVPQQSRFDSGEMPLGSSNDVTKSRSNLTAWLGQCPESHKIETIFNQRFAKRGILYNEVAYVLVGPEKKRYGIHKGLLCHYSTFFTSAFNGKFLEGSTNEIDMKEETVRDFDLFNGWLYTQTLCEPDQTAKDFSWETLVGLYLFADRLIVPNLMNSVMDLLVSKFVDTESIPLTMVATIYLDTHDGSGLRKVLVDAFVHKENLIEMFEMAKKENLHPNSAEFVHPDFVCDVALAYLRLYPDKGMSQFGKRGTAQRYYAPTPVSQSS